MTRAFADPRLDLAVRAAMPQDVLAQPLASLTRLDAAGLGIRRLGGIEQLRELRWLDLCQNPLTRVTELGANTKLIRLLLRHTKLSTVDGLAGLGDLEDLDLYGSGVACAEGLAGLPALRSLDLGLCLVKRLRPLATLARLESLTLGNPSLHVPRRSMFVSSDPVDLDLDPIIGLPSLRMLRLYGLELRSLDELGELAGLEELVVDRCKIRDDLRRVPSWPRLEVLSLANAEIDDLGVLAQLPRLRVLNLDDAKVDDLRPLLGCTSLESISLRDTEVKRRGSIEALRKLPRLSVLRLDHQVVRP